MFIGLNDDDDDDVRFRNPLIYFRLLNTYL